MPTGYTADIKDGITFEQFAMNCARAFGALIMMRDEASDAEIPERFEPSDYHLIKSREAKQKLGELTIMTADKAEEMAQAEHIKAEANRIEQIDRSRTLRAQYTAMLEKVNAWTPPTDEHGKLHAFMVEQIESSIKFDCDEEYYLTPTEKLVGSEWLAKEIERVSKEIKYCTTEYNKEVGRTENRNKWIADLRESLS